MAFWWGDTNLLGESFFYWEEISLGGRNEQIDLTPSQPQFLEGDCWEKGVTFFRGVSSFYIKNKLKSELFNNKKSI